MPVRARRASKPSSIRYLLLADQKLKKISLKRISSRWKRAKQPARLRSSANGKTVERLRTPSSAAMAILLVGAGVFAAAALITARQPSRQPDAAGAEILAMEIGPEENIRRT